MLNKRNRIPPRRTFSKKDDSIKSRMTRILSSIKRTWIILTAAGTLLVAVLMQGPTILENSVKLPEEIESVWNKFSSWKGNDTEWTGIWSNAAEGFVDSADMKLSAIDLRFEIETSKGKLNGTVAARTICKIFPAWNFVLVSGNSSWNSASVEVFDFFAGKKQRLALLELERDGPVLTVRSIEDPGQLFPKESRLALHPEMEIEKEKEIRDAYCSAERVKNAEKK
ncbi:MAG: hypothetical protein WA071_27400 [Undibacterium umbellatum]|uniref:hypothetical protein n=1 Tax=Undibacterium umbellatum TaxID=2762300 RepID=UPI003BB64B2A